MAVYRQLRSEILAGRFDPGRPISQVRLANRLGVSRTPLREAMRMLERDGLVDAEPNRRVRVTSLSIEDVEELYAMRIVIEGFALRLTASNLTSDELDELDTCLQQMDRATNDRDLPRWEDPHSQFHALLATHAGPRLARLAAELAAHGDRCRRVYLQDDSAWLLAAQEHQAIAEACRQRDERLAADHLARHLAKTALTIIAEAAPAHDPAKIRSALQFMEAGGQRPPTTNPAQRST